MAVAFPKVLLNSIPRQQLKGSNPNLRRDREKKTSMLLL